MVSRTQRSLSICGTSPVRTYLDDLPKNMFPLPLNVDWVSLEQFAMGDESGVPDEQEAAWANFWKVVESFQ